MTSTRFGILSGFAVLSFVPACSGDLACGPGTHQEGDLCLPDDGDGTGGGDDTNASDTDEGGPTATSAFLFVPEGTSDCPTWIGAIVTDPDFGVHNFNVYSDGKPQGMLATIDASYQIQVEPHQCGSGSTSPAVPHHVAAGEYYLAHVTPTTQVLAWQVAGTDYREDQLRVRFADGLDPDYAQTVLADDGVSVVTQVGSSPPQFIVSPTDGSTSPQKAVQLLDEDDVAWTMPEPP